MNFLSINLLVALDADHARAGHRPAPAADGRNPQSPIRNPQSAIRNWLVVLIPLLVSPAWAVDFGQEITILRDEASIEFPVNTHGTAAVDSMGRLHLVYGVRDQTGSPPQNQVWYCMVDPGGDVSPPVRVDNADIGGGRHPCLAVDSEDTVHVVWHDYRHTTLAGHWMDNTEIYYDCKPANGAFSVSDIRITDTRAGNLADNGYTPQLAVGPDGRVHIAWYDFTLDGNAADVYLRSSALSGEFPPQVGIEPFRITSIESGSTYTANWMPSPAGLPSGDVYLLWGFVEGWQGSFELRGCTVSADGIAGPSEQVAEDGGSFLDPHRLAADRQGNLGLVYSKRADTQKQIYFQYRPFDGNWSGPVRVSQGRADATQPNLAFDSTGRAHIVWQEDIGGAYRVMYTVLRPGDLSIESQVPLSRVESDARTPAIAVNPQTNGMFVLWLDWSVEGERSIVYREGVPSNVGVDLWWIH
ncbi:MAG TPA: hypothetical protein PLQ35_10935 [bacterium]|nr:hypothetical protein [bacterium]HQL62797.1 hypothetical protein [bacterium]